MKKQNITITPINNLKKNEKTTTLKHANVKGMTNTASLKYLQNRTKKEVFLPVSTISGPSEGQHHLWQKGQIAETGSHRRHRAASAWIISFPKHTQRHSIMVLRGMRPETSTCGASEAWYESSGKYHPVQILMYHDRDAGPRSPSYQTLVLRSWALLL